MKKIYNMYKREIWVGVVVSLITAAIMSFGAWLIEIVPAVGSTLFETISNVLYSLAATHSDNHLLRLILFGGLSVLAGIFSKTIIDGLKLYRVSLRLEKNSKKLTLEDLSEINDQATKELQLVKEQAKHESIPDLVKKGKKIGKAAIWAVVLIAFIYMFITFFVTAPMSLSNMFQQDIIKIAPYVEESEITQLKSDWVCMRSKEDFDAIYERINQIKEEHDLP